MFDLSRGRLMSGILALGLTLAPVAASADDFVNILTGGTAGVSYLARVLDQGFFPELLSVRTAL